MDFDARLFDGEKALSKANIYVSLTYDPLDATTAISRVKSPKAGAVLLFAGEQFHTCYTMPTNTAQNAKPCKYVGCTRDSFASQPVTHLKYSTYAALALKSMQEIASSIVEKHSLVAISITHRLGQVDVGDESILIAVSAAHRTPAWRAGEECLERVKERVEIWKEEHFEDGGVWRSNRDGQAGVPVRP